jgi:hypothetical protein
MTTKLTLEEMKANKITRGWELLNFRRKEK